MKQRVGIIALSHESNSFINAPTTLADFERVGLLTGSAIRDQFQTAPHEVGGFFAGLDQAGIEAVPIFSARAMPSGTISHGTFDDLLSRLQSELHSAGPLDGVLVAPHGAAISEQILDADGHWLGVVRKHVGPDVPMIGTLDPHANLSPSMVEVCDAFVAYRTNPHLDQRERGLEAAALMTRSLAGEIRPRQAAVFLPMAVNIECQDTSVEPWQSIYEWASQQRQRPSVLSTSICFGFPYSDVPEMGTAVLVVADDDRPLAEQLSNELAAQIWTKREELKPELKSIDDALVVVELLARAGKLDSPICLLDMGDNVGGGSPADSTFLAHALHERKISGAFICLCDPASVQQAAAAGVGAQLKLSVGGNADDLHGAPLEADFTVLSLHHGRFAETAARHGGFTKFDQGPTAIVRTDRGLTIMLTSHRVPPFSLQQIRSCGLDPAAFCVLVAKGVHAPVAAYREVCRQFIRVNTPGSTSADLSGFKYQHRRQPMFSFESDVAWPNQ